ncbi:hypothetical protein GH714_031545 [Hevea brasiliensis]|uniref:Uncharacterized protein n=1 Tax=Hevea brasiliensis TaxID=3981 RepID=A0A6A6M673_HEVBR|nr:hypothetical protein GH714_031545 [Hevea brasiliensis]
MWVGVTRCVGRSFLGAKTPTMAFHDQLLSTKMGDGVRVRKHFHSKREEGASKGDQRKKPGGKDKKMKTKMNKKCMQRNGNEDGEEVGDKETKEGVHVDHRRSSSTKKRVRGGALMEGSRCSRVNGEDGGVANKHLWDTLFVNITWAKEG